jgi:predicted dehydrogenase/nucleoside-diphosphate-sugar epimerase
MKYAIVGGGSVTTEFYLPALRLMDRLAHAVVIDPDARSIVALHPDFDAVEFREQDYASFLKDTASLRRDEPLGVVIALPNRLHVDAARLALEQNHHVLCEKPLALAAADCARLRALATAKGRLLKVSMARRYLPSLMVAREIVVANELGAVRSVEIRDCTPFPWRPRSFAFFAPQAGGVLADMGVHYLDYLDTLLGALEPVAYTDDAKGGIESRLTYKLVASGIPVDMHLSRLHREDSYLKIRCERGEVVVNKANENEVVVTPTGATRRRISAQSPFDDASWPSSFQGSFCQLLADFGRAVDGRASRIADVADAERAAALIEWAYARRPYRAPATAVGSGEIIGRGTALVTGGSGFIGGHLVERLSRDGSKIRVAARSPGKCANVARFPVEFVATDLLDKSFVQTAVAGARTVYHLAYGTDGDDPARITIDGTKHVVEAAIAAGADCVVVLSTMYVFGFPQEGVPVDESFPYRPYGGEYGNSKAIMERWCLERARTSLPTRIVVLNPTCVFGPGGGAYTSLPIDLARQGQFCWIDGGSGLCNYNYVENLIDAIMTAAEVADAHGDRFIINDGAVSWREFFAPFLGPLADQVPSYSGNELARLPRYGGPFRASDLVAAALAAPEIRTVAKRSALVRRAFASLKEFVPEPHAAIGGTGVTTAPAAMPPEWLGPLYGPARSTFSAQKAHKILGWRPLIALDAARAVTVHWLVESGRLSPTKVASDR